MGAYSDNFYSWLDSQNLHEKVAMDMTLTYNGYIHPNGELCTASSIERCPYYSKDKHKALEIDGLDQKRGLHYRDIRDAVAKKCNADGTYNLGTGQPVRHTKGFQVSFQEETTERKGHAAYISDDEYDRKVEALMKELGVEPDLGKFGEPEICFCVESREKALEVARRFNQESIWDWQAMDVVANPDFNGASHYADRDNHQGKNYHEHDPKPNNSQNASGTKQTP